MSLVNDALKKARLEAARGEAAKRGIPYPILGRGNTSGGARWLAAGVLLIVIVAISGALLYNAGQRSALDQSVAAAVPTEPVSEARPAEATSSSGEASAERRTQPADILLQTSGRQGDPATDNQRGDSTPAPPRPASPRPKPRPVESSAPTEQVPAEPAISRRSSPPPAEIANRPEGAVVAEPAELRPVALAELTDDRAPAETAGSAAEQEFLRRAEIPGVGPVELGGIAWSGDRPFALVNGRVVRPGDTIVGLVVDEIQPNTVRFRGEAGTLIFKLK